MFAQKRNVAWLIVFMLLSVLVISQCSPKAPMVQSGPTPEATGLAEYVPPSGGLVEEIKKRVCFATASSARTRPASFSIPPPVNAPVTASRWRRCWLIRWA